VTSASGPRTSTFFCGGVNTDGLTAGSSIVAVIPTLPFAVSIKGFRRGAGATLEEGALTFLDNAIVSKFEL
jgi:hypothetical protein